REQQFVPPGGVAERASLPHEADDCLQMRIVQQRNGPETLRQFTVRHVCLPTSAPREKSAADSTGTAGASIAGRLQSDGSAKPASTRTPRPPRPRPRPPAADPPPTPAPPPA